MNKQSPQRLEVTEPRTVRIILFLFQITILVLTIVGSFLYGWVLAIFRILIIGISIFRPDPEWGAVYGLFGLVSALMLVDPVGLFVIKHGTSRTPLQNYLCVLALLLSAVVSYLGYEFKKSLSAGSNPQHGNPQQGNPQYGNPQYENSPNRLAEPSYNPNVNYYNADPYHS